MFPLVQICGRRLAADVLETWCEPSIVMPKVEIPSHKDCQAAALALEKCLMSLDFTWPFFFFIIFA